MASISGDFKEGGQWTATASSFSGNQTVSLSADVNPLSKVRTADLTISAAGISKSCTVSLTQEASEFEAELTVVAIPAFAAGGSSYTATSTSGHITIKRNGVVIDDRNVMPAFRFKSGSEVSWVTLSGGSGSWTYTITAENRALVAGGARSATLEAQYSLDVGGVQTLLVCDVPISQAANFVETVSVSDASFAYSTIAAAGATVTPTTDSTIAVTMSSGSVLSSASAIAGYTYTLTPSFSMTNGSGFTLNSTTTGSLTAASMGTTLGSRQSPTITYSLLLTYTPSSELSDLGANTVSGSDSSTGTATQGVNEVTSSTLVVTAFNYSGTVAASGGTSVAPNITVQKNRVYTSGATDSVPVTTYTKTFSIVNDYDSGATIDASTGLVTFPSRGTTVGLLLNIQVGLVISADGLSANSQAGCTQAMNKIESFVVMDISFDWPQFSPAGESHLPTHVGEWCQATYSSGVTGERAKPPVGYTIASNTAVYSLAESSSVFTIVDASTGEVSAANMGTTLGSRTSPRIWKDITIVLAAGSWANGTVENISGTGRAFNLARQGANEITYSDLTIKTFAYSATPTVAASGGTSVPSLDATETWIYTSGSVVSDVPATGGSFALTTSGHGASVNSSTGVVTYASRGSVAGDAWSDSVTWTLTSHGLTATKSASVSQAANVETFVDHSNTYAADPSYDGHANIVVVTGGTVTATPGARLSYTSGSTVVKDVSASSTSEPVSLGAGASWDASSWTLTIPSAGTSVYPEDDSYSCTIKVTTPYGTTYFYMYRQANLQTITGIRLAAPSVSGDSWVSDWSAVPAAGGNLACAGYNQYSYTSGSTNEVRITDFSDVTVNTSVSWVEVLEDDVTYPMSLHVLSRGVVAGTPRSSSVSWTRAGFTSNSLTFGQVANIKTLSQFGTRCVSSNKPTTGTGVGSDFWVKANGGTLTVTCVAQFTYTSGSVESNVDVTADSTSTYDGTSSPYATWDSENWIMTFASAGTTVMPDSYAAITAKYQDRTLDSSFGRQANEATYDVPVLQLSYSDIAASGGSVTPLKSFTQSVSYTSGSTSTVTSGGTWSYSGTSVNTSTGAVSASSLGTTVKSRSKITTATASLMVNGKTGSTTADVYQAANSATYGAVTISGGTVADIPASGGSVSSASGISGSQTVSFTSGDSRPGTVSFSYSTAVSAPSLGTTVKSRTLIGTLDATAIGDGGVTATKSFDVYQEANVAVYGTPVVSLSYSDVPAKGGSVAPTKSFRQTVTYTSGSTGTPVTVGGSWSYSGTNVSSTTGAVSGSALGYTVKARTKLTDATAAITVNGKTGSASVAVYQQENYVLSVQIKGQNWITPVNPTLSFPAEGATNSYTCYGTFTSGTVRVRNFALDDWDLSNSVFTKVLNTNVLLTVTAPSRGTTVGDARTSTLTVTLNNSDTNNKTLTDSVTLTQEANAIVSYGTPVVSLSYADIPAGGGSVTPSKSFTQATTYTSGSTGSISSGGSWSYSGTGVNTSTGAVSGTSLGTTEVSRTKKTDATATITINGKSGSATVAVYQEANTIVTAGPVTITDAEVADIPASGGSISEFSSYDWTQDVTYTSGVTDTSNYHTTSYSAPVTASSLGSTVKSRTKVGTLTLEVTGEKNESAILTLDVYQAANTATYSSPSITASYGSDIPAGGGTVSLTKSFTQGVTYTSGSTSTVSSGGSWSYSQTSGSGLNTSTGAVTAASLGTTAKARTQVASVRVQLTANNKTEAVMASAYQEANSRTWGTPTITTFEYRGTPAVNTLSAGADNRNPTLLATQTGTWTSGETETASLISSKTFTGGDVNTSTGNYTVTSLGNVVTARQLEATITVNITMNGKTASDSLSLYREANEVTYSDPIVTHTSPISVAASAGSYTLSPHFTQRAFYTSGSETPILSGSFSYAVKTALTGFSVNSGGLVSYTANPSVSARNGFVVTITGSGNGKSGTTDVTFNQAGANPTIQVSLNGTSYGSSVTVNLEGKSASEVSVYVKTNDTFDVS